ncbi:MAG: tetratricopeptide repeat protein [Candidatus Omnitrophica bacterium]|nr:tetratricopeptide repeat protein [Candidatus Omnitrophota bacterium]
MSMLIWCIVGSAGISLLCTSTAFAGSSYEEEAFEEAKAEAEALFQEAKILLEQQRFNEAQDRLIEALGLYPGHRLARIYLEQLDRIIEQGVTIPTSDVKHKISQEEKRQAVFEPSTLDARQIRSLYNRGRYLYKEGDYPSAIAMFQKILEVEPDHRGASRYLKKALEETGADVAALPERRPTQEREGGFSLDVGYNQPAAIQTSVATETPEDEAERIKRAAEEKALRAQMDLYAELLQKGQDAFDGGQYGEAIGHFEAALEVVPDSAAAREYIRIARAKQLAAEHHREETKPLDETETSQVGISARPVYTTAAAPKQEAEYLAREKAEIRKALLDKEIQLHYEKGHAFLNEGNYGGAIEEFKKVIQIDPTETEAQSLLEKAKKTLERDMQKQLITKRRAEKKALEVLRDQDKERIAEVQRIAKEKEEAEIQKRKEIEQRKRERIKQREEEIKETSRMREDRLKQLLANAKFLYDEGEYDKSQAFIDALLEEDPNNQKAVDFAHMLRLAKVDREQEEYEKEIEVTDQKMLLEVTKKNLIPDEYIGDGDEGEAPEKGADKTVDYHRLPSQRGATHQPSKIRKQLDQLVTLDFKDVDLISVLNYLSDVTGINVVPSSAIALEEYKATIRVKNMPFKDALRYLLKSLGLTYRIDEDAIWVATPDDIKNEKIETRVYSLNKGIHATAKLSQSAGAAVVGLGDSQSLPEVTTIKDLLQEAVDFPKGSNLVLDERTGSLIATNTPSNLQIVEDILTNLDTTPIQILIETRFIEVNMSDLEHFGFDAKLNSDWGLTRRNVPDGNKVQVDQDSGVNFSSFSARGDEGFNLTFRGVLTHPQFELVLHMLEEETKAHTLSAPKVTTLNNQTATIQVVDDFIYPTRYEISFVPQDDDGDGQIEQGEGEFLNLPQDFVTRKEGIILKVTPTVGMDQETITLSLVPEVSDFSQYDNFGGGVTLPRFTSRSLTTSAIIKNNETVVLGGLIKETNTNAVTKVPILSKLPLIGKAFQKKIDNVERRNLLIFVTARIINNQQNRQPQPARDKGSVL